MNADNESEIFWLPQGEDDSGQSSPIRVWKTIRMMAVGEAYRVRTSPGLFTQNVIQPRTTRIPAERLSSDLREWGTFEFTVVQTTAEGGEKAHVMRRIA